MALDRKAVLAALRAIENKNGQLTPEEIVRVAKNPKHPLHPFFEWDDRKAGMLHRIEQARALLADVRWEITHLNLSKAIQYVRDPAAPTHTQGYIATRNLANDEEQARAAVIYEVDRAVAILRRVRDVAAALNVETDVEDVIRRTEALGLTVRRLRIAS